MALPPPQTPPPAGAAPTTPSRGARRWLVPTAIGVVGLGVGLLVGALAFGGDDTADAPEGAAADVAAGCRSLAGIPDEGLPEPGDEEANDEWGLDGPYLWRVQSVSTSFRAAAAADREYRSVGEDAEELTRAYQQFQTDEANDILDDLRDWCADHDLAP